MVATLAVGLRRRVLPRSVEIRCLQGADALFFSVSFEFETRMAFRHMRLLFMIH